MLSLNEIFQKMQKLENWSIDGNNLVFERDFGSFSNAMEFIVNVAKLSEEERHHPGILIEYGLVKLNLTTHEANSITEKDFYLAEKINKLIFRK